MEEKEGRPKRRGELRNGVRKRAQVDVKRTSKQSRHSRLRRERKMWTTNERRHKGRKRREEDRVAERQKKTKKKKKQME